jgi:alginate O-acetyltransferase complex protein AlgI
MLFNSFAFAIFLPLVLAGYYVLTKRGQNIWILLASLVFYGWWDPRFLLLLAVPTIIDYVCALKIKAADGPGVRKRYLAISLITNLTILGFFKYFNFFIDSASQILEAFGRPHYQPLLYIILPVGISFYTFHEISYVVDVYRGELDPVKDFSVYLNYVLYFPQLVAGPIARAKQLLPQLKEERRVNWRNIQEGLLLMLIGYFKKVGIADVLSPFVEIRFANPSLCAGSDLLFALYLFSIQIYCDFSGYTDIARGVSKLFGIELQLNFNHPYFAANITDFWRRWHISLSTWLRDYLYIPLGGNKKGVLKTYRNLMVTMLLGGLWHGASWTFVVWGGLHGLYLSVHKLMLDRRSDPAKLKRHVWWKYPMTFIKVILTFHLVALTWIFFRAGSFKLAWAYLKGILTWQAVTTIEPMHWFGGRITILLCMLLIIETVQYWAKDQTVLLRLNWARQGAVYAVLIIAILVLGGVYAEIPFIYFQF